MKIIMVLNKFLPDQIAGIEIYTKELCKKLNKKEIQTKILIPNFKNTFSQSYKYEDLDITQYEESPITDRKLIMGFRKPDGLNSFVKLLEIEKPDIIHFHEIAGSNGITIHHISEAKKSGAKVVITFHLSSLSCMTGAVLKNGITPCDGKIELFKCSNCYLKSKNTNRSQRYILIFFSSIFYLLKTNVTRLSNRLGTAFGTFYLIEKKKYDLLELASLSDKIIVISNWYKKVLLANGIQADKLFFISQGLPIENVLLTKTRALTEKLKFIFVGRVSHFKGVHLLIEAFQQLESDKAELHIYGQPDNIDFEFGLKKKTLNTSSIQWKGIISNTDIINVMSNYDALCLPSTTSEMSPLVIQEAFAAGLPVIASNVFGNAEQISHEVNGLLFKFNDSKDLLKMLKRCIEEKELLSNLSRNILRPRSFEEVANGHIKLYNSLFF